MYTMEICHELRGIIFRTTGQFLTDSNQQYFNSAFIKGFHIVGILQKEIRLQSVFQSLPKAATGVCT